MRHVRMMATLLLLAGWPSHAGALSCAESKEDFVPQNELIVKAKIVAIDEGPHIPILRNPDQEDWVVTFEIVDAYRAPEGMPGTFDAAWTPFFRTWGAKLKLGQEGEYLFDRKGKDGWAYAGPGGCTFVSEKAWRQLRGAE